MAGASIRNWFLASLKRHNFRRANSTRRRRLLEELEVRCLLSSVTLNPVADGVAADRNLDGVYETAVVNGLSISNRWFNDPSIGQERGIFEFNLSQLAPGAQISSARLRLNVNSYTFSTQNPQFSVLGYAGNGAVSAADGGVGSSFLGSSTITGLGVNEVVLDAATLQTFVGATAGIRVQNSALSGQWFTATSLENSSSLPTQLVLEIIDPPVAISPLTGLTTSESGGTATFNVVLSTQPVADVTLTLSSSDLSEGTVSSDSLTFTSANWNVPQVVTVTGVSDPDLDGNVAYSIITSPLSSADPSFNGYNPPDVSVVNMDSEWTRLSLSGGNLAIADITTNGKNDALTIQSDITNSKFIISDPNFSLIAINIPGAVVSPDLHVIEIPFSSVTGTEISVFGQSGNDSLTIDYSLGSFSKTIAYNGSIQSTVDSLTLIGGAFGTITHTPTTAAAGIINVPGNSPITYTDLESVVDSLNAADRVFSFFGGAETIQLNDAAGARMTIDSTLSVPVTFSNPTDSLTINAGSGSDTVSIVSVDSEGPYNGSMTVNGDAGSDQVSLIGDITFAPGRNLNVDLQNDAVTGDQDRIVMASNANIRTFGNGTITLKTNRDINLAAGSSLEVVNGDLVVEANQQTTPLAGFFQGVNISGGLLRTSGTGNVTVRGRGGNDSSTSTHIGVYVQAGGAIESTSSVAGAGTITVVGTGGFGSIVNYGVRVFQPNSRITSVIGDIHVTATGGAGTGAFNGGILVDIGGAIRSLGTGPDAADITVTGTGAAGTNLGVGVHVDSASITTIDGDIVLNGTGGSGSGNYNIGVDVFGSTGLVSSTGTGPSAGTITINGTGGSGTDFNTGVFIDGSGRVRSVDGAVNLNGTAVDLTGTGNNGIHFETGGGLVTTGSASTSLTGAAASLSTFGIAMLSPSVMTFAGDSTFISDRTSISASGVTISAASKTVAFRPKTNGQGISLGFGDTVSSLGLSNAELNAVNAGTIQIGDTSSGAITVSSAITHAPGSNFALASAGNIRFSSGGTLSNGSGTVLLTPGGAGNVQFGNFGTDLTTTSLSFGSGADVVIPINGTLVDSQYNQLNLNGQVNLNGVDLGFSGSYSPTDGDTFVIVDNDGIDPVVGTFNGLPEGATVIVNGTAKKISYVGGTGNDVILSSPTLTLSIAPLSISENGGVAEVTLSRSNSDNSAPLTVSLASNDVSELEVPVSVTIPAGQSFITFTVSALDDALLDGTQDVAVSAAASGYFGASQSVSVTDYETLGLSFTTSSITENAGVAAAFGTVTRNNTDTSEALTVNLTSSDTSEAAVPVSVVIPAGQSSITFAIDAIDDLESDGLQTVNITASALGYVSTSSSIDVTDAATISDLTDRLVDEDTATPEISFTAGDSAELILTGSSSNTLLVPNANIVFTGSGSSRILTVTPAPNQSGSATITVTVIDSGTVISDTFVLTVSPVNDAPVANAGGPYTVTEGSAFVPDASQSFDLEDLSGELTYAWDMNYDGTSFDIDATGISPSVVYPDNFNTRAIAVRVTDSGGLSHIATTTLTVSNAAPTAQVTGPSTGVSGQRRTFTLGATDPSPSDQAANFIFNIEWGDGTSQVVTGPAGIAVEHVFAATGAYVVRVTATDKDGAFSVTSAELPLSIVAAQIQGNDLVIGGTTGNDTFTLTPGSSSGTFTVGLGAVSVGTFTLGSSGLVTVFGQAGTDSVTINGKATADTFRVLDMNTIAFNGTEIRGQSAEGWRLNGLGGTDSLIGPDLTNTWLLTTSGGGTLNGSIQFATMENLTGGAVTDTFRISANGSISGSVNGGAGRNVLDYSARTSAVVVNLANSTATSLGSVGNFTVVVGGSGSDTITGGSSGSILLGGAGSDSLRGGNGRDLLIGGSNSDTLRGGAGEDILCGGRTSYFNESTRVLDLVSLDAIFEHWNRTDLTYTTRINNLTTGVAGAQVNSSTFSNDSNSPDDLFGEDGLDWYLVSRKDRLRDVLSNETVSNI